MDKVVNLEMTLLMQPLTNTYNYTKAKYLCFGICYICFSGITKLLLTPVSVQVDPQLAANVVFHAWILLIVQAVKSTTNNCIYLYKEQTWII